MIKAGIFDVGGVIVKYIDKFAFSDITEELKISEEQFKNTLKENRYDLSIGKISEEKFWELFLKSLNINYKTSKLMQIYRNSYVKYLKENNLIDEEIMNKIKQLKDRGVKLAVIANTIPQNVDVYKSVGIYDDFDVLVLSCFEGIKKPNSQIFTTAINKLGVQPQETFFVDDGERHVNAANGMGIVGIKHNSTEKTINTINGLL